MAEEGNPNYCQHPECHNSHVAYYWDSWSTWTHQAWTSPHVDGRWISWNDAAFNNLLTRRWCKSHALIFEGVALG